VANKPPRPVWTADAEPHAHERLCQLCRPGKLVQATCTVHFASHTTMPACDEHAAVYRAWVGVTVYPLARQ